MSKGENIVVIGAGGHAKVVVDAILAQGKYTIQAVIQDDPIPENGKTILGYEVIHSSHLSGKKIDCFIVAIGCDNTRKEQFLKYKKQGYHAATIIHPQSIIARNVIVSEGSVILAGVIINPDSNIGANVIINTGVIIEHDVSILSHSQLSPGAVVCGGCCVDEKVYIGANSVIRQCIHIVNDSIIGCGASVVCNITESGTYVGVPAKRKE
ncbi:NeuD/PglB/VioB family sugar acetyltransferase [Cysteiniphilum sp. 6C5]|uniref:NeuD/PglB/VioB family sugar acetyltransferase n=1 Tax=unclassified Cysteiniphilum TaxID=2610889 RepID=UPI003F8527F9